MMYDTYDWAIVKINVDGDPFYKLIASIGRGRNDWRINSGITNIFEDEHDSDYIIVEGASGSNYLCDKGTEGVSRVTMELFERLTNIPDTEITLVDYIDVNYNLMLDKDGEY